MDKHVCDETEGKVAKTRIDFSPADLSDKDLHGLAVRYGGNAKQWLKRFGGLLPEVFRRRIYKKHGCASIHQYANVFAGMNERTVDKILSLRKRLEGKPALLTLFESGQQGWAKLERVLSIASAENDLLLAQKVETLPTTALLAYVKAKRRDTSASGQPGPTSEACQVFSKRPTPYSMKSFRISRETLRKLKILKQTLEKDRNEALSWNELFAAWLDKTETKTVVVVCPACAQQKGIDTKNRSIPENVKRVVRARSGGTCEANCAEPACIFHHKRRWALKKCHDPRYITHLCLAHHDLVHFCLIANEDDPPNQWRCCDEANGKMAKARIDKKYQKMKRFVQGK